MCNSKDTAAASPACLTADQIGITADEHAGLLWTADCLDPARPDVRLPPWLSVRMDVWIRSARVQDNTLVCGIDTEPCGTAACIGGMVAMHRLGLHKLEVGEEPSADVVAELTSILSHERYSEALTELYWAFPKYRWLDQHEVLAAVRGLLAGNTQDPWGTVAARVARQDAKAAGQETRP